MARLILVAIGAVVHWELRARLVKETRAKSKPGEPNADRESARSGNGRVYAVSAMVVPGVEGMPATSDGTIPSYGSVM